MDLKNKEKIKELDSMGIGKALELFPEQIKTSFEQAMNSNISKIKCSSVVICGMGGSSNAGKIVQSMEEPKNEIAFTVFNDYGLPFWVDNRTLVVLNSYSGNTEETVSAFKTAKEKGASIIGIATGGKIGKLIEDGEIKGAIIDPKDTNPSDFPKSALGVSLGALFGALNMTGAISITKDELFSALDELVEIRNDWSVEKKAEWLNGYMPVLFSSRTLLGPLNAGRNAMCEISRVYSQYYDFPEMNHVLIEATQVPVEALEKNRYLFFESEFDHDRIKLRYTETKKVFDEQGLTYNSYKLKGTTPLTQSLELAHYCAWAGFHMSILRGVDPGPEPWIIKLKKSLSQPVH